MSRVFPCVFARARARVYVFVRVLGVRVFPCACECSCLPVLTPRKGGGAGSMELSNRVAHFLKFQEDLPLGESQLQNLWLYSDQVCAILACLLSLSPAFFLLPFFHAFGVPKLLLLAADRPGGPGAAREVPHRGGRVGPEAGRAAICFHRGCRCFCHQRRGASVVSQVGALPRFLLFPPVVLFSPSGRVV